MRQRAQREFPILFQGLTFISEDAVAGRGNSGCGLVLRRKNVTTGPTDRGTQMRERLDEDGGLDGHVQRTRNAHAFEWFCGAVLLPQSHEAGHFVLGDLDFFSPQFRKAKVAHIEVGFWSAVGPAILFLNGTVTVGPAIFSGGDGARAGECDSCHRFLEIAACVI